MQLSHNRRTFLKAASWGALGQVAGVSPLRSFTSLAQSSSNDYKALVCIFLRGGNDSNNMIVPLDLTQHSSYSKARGPLAIAQSSLLPLAGVGYGLHPSMPNLAAAFATGKAAVIANVGPLVQPTTAAQYKASLAQLPEALMTHNGQQEAWETGGYHAGTGTGWGGLTADLMSSSYNSSALPMVTLLGPATNFGVGHTTAPFSVGGNSQGMSFYCSEGGSCAPRNTAAQQLLTFNTGVSLLQADQQIYQDAYRYSAVYNKIIANVGTMKTQFPSSCVLSPSLITVSNMIKLHSQIGARRQIFLIDLAGFDTHDSQSAAHASLLSQLDATIEIFLQSMNELGMSNNVTLFTASDFARTLEPNGSLGSDHGWGGHHVVVGGAVKGGKIYGTFPTLQLNGPDDIDGSGRWAPTTALSQYTGTLASWFGVPAINLPSILPGLANFSTKNLGFV